MSSPTVSRPYTQEMVMVHRVFRRELRLLPGFIRATASSRRGDESILADALAFQLDGLHVHHHGEDEILWPLLRDRASLDEQLVARMEEQHTRVAEQIAAVRATLARWRPAPTAPLAARLADEVDALADTLDEHLADEERHILPLAAEHVSGAEWDRLAEHGLAEMGKAQLLMTLGAILEEATPGERAAFLGKVPLPGRVAWAVVGRRRYRRAMRQQRGHG